MDLHLFVHLWILDLLDLFYIPFPSPSLLCHPLFLLLGSSIIAPANYLTAEPTVQLAVLIIIHFSWTHILFSNITSIMTHMNITMMTSGGLAPCLASSVVYLIEFWAKAAWRFACTSMDTWVFLQDIPLSFLQTLMRIASVCMMLEAALSETLVLRRWDHSSTSWSNIIFHLQYLHQHLLNMGFNH